MKQADLTIGGVYLTWSKKGPIAVRITGVVPSPKSKHLQYACERTADGKTLAPRGCALFWPVGELPRLNRPPIYRWGDGGPVGPLHVHARAGRILDDEEGRAVRLLLPGESATYRGARLYRVS